MSDSLRSHGLWPIRLLCPWDSPGKNAGVACHFLLQGIFLTTERTSLVSPAWAGGFFTSSGIWRALWRPQIRLWNLSASGSGQGSATHPVWQVSRPRVLSLSPGRCLPRPWRITGVGIRRAGGFTPGYSWSLPAGVRVKITAIHSQ